MLAKVNIFISASILHIINRPSGYWKNLKMFRLKLLFKRMLTPALLLAQQLNSALELHSQVHVPTVLTEQWTSCSMYTEFFLDLSQLNTFFFLRYFLFP